MLFWGPVIFVIDDAILMVLGEIYHQKEVFVHCRVPSSLFLCISWQEIFDGEDLK